MAKRVRSVKRTKSKPKSRKKAPPSNGRRSTGSEPEDESPASANGSGVDAIVVKTLPTPEFSDEDQEQIITDLLALKKEQIAVFLQGHGLPKTGTKTQLRERIEAAIEEATITVPQIVQYLDEVIPWGKQHVYLYKGPQGSIADWQKREWVSKLLKKHRLGKYLNANLPLVLPEKMKVSSIVHDGRRLRIIAIKKREWWERNEEYDDTTTTREGDDVDLRAFVHRVTRSLVAFEWDLVANVAFLQVSQLPRGFKYELVASEFFELISAWLDINIFTLVDLRPAIKKLNKDEVDGKAEIRSHGVKYQTLQGRRFEGKSPSPSDPLIGEAEIDAAMGAVRNAGIGHEGNFYWLNNGATNNGYNPLEAEVHVLIIGPHNRINFPKPSDEQTIRYVLSRIRSNSS